MVFELGPNGCGLGLMIFHKMSLRTHYQQFVTKSLMVDLCYKFSKFS